MKLDSESELESELETDSDSQCDIKLNYKYNLTSYKKPKKIKKEKKLTFHEIVLKEMESKTYNSSKEAGIDPEFYYSIIHGLCHICTKDWPRQYKHSPPCNDFVNNNFTADMMICHNSCNCGNCISVCKNHCNCK